MVMKLKDAIANGTINLPQDVIDKINAAEAGKASAVALDATQVASKATADQAVAQNLADQAAASQGHQVANNLAAVALDALKVELGLA